MRQYQVIVRQQGVRIENFHVWADNAHEACDMVEQKMPRGKLYFYEARVICDSLSPDPVLEVAYF